MNKVLVYKKDKIDFSFICIEKKNVVRRSKIDFNVECIRKLKLKIFIVEFIPCQDLRIFVYFNDSSPFRDHNSFINCFNFP